MALFLAVAVFPIMSSFRFIPVAYDRTRQLAVVSLVWFGIAAGSVVLLIFNPASPASQGFFPQCPFRMITGLQCPGCGTTRACYQLIHLHPVAAFKLNPLMMMTLPFIIYGLVGFTKSAVTGQPQRRVFIPSFYLWAWVVVMIAFWIFRNTPWYPFVS